MSQSQSRITAVPTITGANPVGLVEEHMINQDWNSERSSEHELWAELPSQWGTQKLWVVFHEDTAFLQFNCYLNLKIPGRKMAYVTQTITLMNERVWLGHFEIWGEELTPVFRIVLPLRGTEFVPEQLEDIIVTIVNETERFFPAFQWVIWGGKTPEEAIAAAIVETEGEA